jgi:AAA domain
MNQPTTEPAVIPELNSVQEAARAFLAKKGKTWTGTSDISKVPDGSDGPIAKTLDEFVRPLANDPAELLKHRFLCKGGGLLLVGPTGHGKSSLAMQLMIKFALGQPVFGIEPARPLKSLLIQAENDEGDLAEMKCGVINGLNLSDEEVELAEKSVLVCQESSRTGQVLCSSVIEPLLNTVKPDLLWIDPALAYIGSDMNSQKDVGTFLRNGLAPLIAKYGCGVVIIHHTNKISKDPDKQMNDFAYLGAGSAEWANWSRAILALNKTDVDNLYELIAAKRGGRLKWRTGDGASLSMKRYIGHCRKPDTICWIEMAIAEAEELRANSGKTAEDVMKHVPQQLLIAKDELIKVCCRNDIGQNLTRRLIEELIESDQLYEVAVPRVGKRPKVLISRTTITLPATLVLDNLSRDSQGNYTIPEGKKTL